MAFALRAERVFNGQEFLADHAVVVEADRIAGLMAPADLPAGVPLRDLGAGVLAPGFIDVQVNGGGGVQFNDDPSPESLAVIARAHRRFGTTTLIPTLITDTWPVMTATAEAVRQAIARGGVPGIRGVHFEGPYLNVARKGVHDPAIIRPVDSEAADLFTGPGLGVVVVTLAPEQTGPEIIADLDAAGVRVCAGHTAATGADIETAIEAGLAGFTHLFNAMSPMENREPGVVGAALADDRTWCSVIVDGYHVHPTSLRVALAAKAAGKMMLVTDAMATVGAVEKTFVLNGETIHAMNGRCALADGTLAGSDLDMISAVRNTVRLCGQDLATALAMATRHPAEFLGLGAVIGRIGPGAAADMVYLDPDLNVDRVWIAGSEDEEQKIG